MGQAFVQSRASVPLSPFLFLFGPSLLLGFGGAFSLSLSLSRVPLNHHKGRFPAFCATATPIIRKEIRRLCALLIL